MPSYNCCRPALLVVCLLWIEALHLVGGQSVDPTTVQVGDSVCFEGFIMDFFCINLGTLLDNRSVVSLMNPELHSLHCLLDISVCRDSPYEMLQRPSEAGGMFTRAFRLDDDGKDAIIDLGRAAGSEDGGSFADCFTCTGTAGSLQAGLRAEVRGTVTAAALADGTPATLRLMSAVISNGQTDVCAREGGEPMTASAAPQAVSSSTSAPNSSPSITPTPEGNGTCFSGVSTVTVQDRKEQVPMEQLNVGDRVLTNTNEYETIYAFGHRDVDQLASFLTFQMTNSTSLGSSLEISPEHLLFVQGRQGPIRADGVKVGDVLVRIDQQYLLSEAPSIVEIKTVQRSGVYAPLTPSGTIVVNGFLASTYAGLLQSKNDANEYVEVGTSSSSIPLRQEDAIHLFMSPLRLACTLDAASGYCLEHDEHGVHKYVAIGMKLLRWGQGQNVMVQVLGLVFVLSVMALVRCMELFQANGIIILSMLIGAYSLFRVKGR